MAEKAVGSAGTLTGRVRHARQPPPGRPRRPRTQVPSRRGDGHARDARDPPRAPRGRRRLRGRQAVRRRGAGARARPGRPEGARAGPAGREDRPRGAHRAHGLVRLEARLRTPAGRRPPVWAPGIRQDDDCGEARAPPAQAREEDPGPRRRRPPAAGRDRPARAAGAPAAGAGLPHRDAATRSSRRGRASSARPPTGATS